MRILTITEESHRKRADVFLAAHYPQFARSALSKLFSADMVKINNKPEKAGYKLREGEVMSVDDTWLVEKIVEDIELPIIYEDDDVLVIDKPAGVLSHSRGGLTQEASVASFLRSHVDKSMSGERAGIVHRLDRVTSGVMICGKNETAMSILQKQFHDHKVKKTYVAVVSKEPKEEKALIDAPIGRDPRMPKRFKVDAHGKVASTQYEVTKRGKHGYMLRLQPKTGRTHQLRVHLAYINCPIIGDELYDGEKSSRLLLHAQKLEITLPSGEKKVFESKLPKEFEDALV